MQNVWWKSPSKIHQVWNRVNKITQTIVHKITAFLYLTQSQLGIGYEEIRLEAMSVLTEIYKEQVHLLSKCLW